MYAQAPPKVDSRRPDTVTASLPAAPNALKRGAKSGQTPIPGVGTETKDAPSKVQVVIGVSKSSTLTIAEMACEIVPFSHDTRSVTCGLSGSQSIYSGVLIVHFVDGTAWSRSVTVEQPLNNGVRSVWGVAAIPIYGTKDVKSVEFNNGGTLAEWDQTQAARDVLGGTYNYPQQTGTYPPAVHVKDFACHVSGFLIGKSQAEITPTYSVTCMLSGDVPYYGGWLALWFHQYEQYLAGDHPTATPPVPKIQSTLYTANYAQYVQVAHDILSDGQQYWAPAAVLFESPVTIAIDRINFYPEREAATFVPPVPPPPPPPVKPAKAQAFEKIFFRHRYCDEDSCLRPPG